MKDLIHADEVLDLENEEDDDGPMIEMMSMGDGGMIVEEDENGNLIIAARPDSAGDTVEEYDEADGTHVRKETHRENGMTRTRITKSGGSGGGGLSPLDMMMGGPPPGLI